MAIDFVKAVPGNTMTLKITAGTRIGGQPVEVGQVVRVSFEDALNLLSGHKAVKYTEPEPKPEVKAEVKPEPKSDSPAKGKGAK